MEHHLGEAFPNDALLALRLFIGGSNLEPCQARFDRAVNLPAVVNPKIRAQELRQRRLVSRTIELAEPVAWQGLIKYFSDHIEILTSLAFSRGSAARQRDFADLLVYSSNRNDTETFVIELLAQASKSGLTDSAVRPGARNGGSTMLLPTGSLQMHRPQGDNLLQFRHDFDKVKRLYSGI
jgi:hypothetical protein